MPVTIQISKTVYSVKDLINNPEYIDIKNKVLEKYFDINAIDKWYESVYEYETDKLKEFGFDVEKIYFSGFASQGDGAMFEGYFNLNKDSSIELISSYVQNGRVAKLIKNGLIEISVKFVHKGDYYHENSFIRDFEISHEGKLFYIEDYENIYSTLDSIDTMIINNYKSNCREIYKNLESSYDYLTSEKIIFETLEVNGFEFDELGNIFSE